MSDAITDISRDSKLKEIDIKISSLEGKFLKEPSPELAKEIINELNGIVNMPRGYWKSVNTQKAKQNIKNYKEYLEDY
jgi:hypothetical protein